MQVFQQWALEEFAGCDGGDPGSREAPSIWLFGIEHGDAPNKLRPDDQDATDDYSVEIQLGYHFNRNAFKFLAAINGHPVHRSREFAQSHQPWVKGAHGYFKGNIYPYPCQKTSVWGSEAAEYTGFASKKTYIDWCSENRLPLIRRWADKYGPQVFIGVGITCRNEYSRAFYGMDVPFDERKFLVNGHSKRIFLAERGGKKLVVIPHLSGGRHGLNSDEALQIAGSVVAKHMGVGKSG